jgi:hypothetical protein
MMHSESGEMRHGSARRVAAATSWQTRTGIVLVVVSCVLYAALIAVPFLPVGGSAKLAIAMSLAVIGEGTFWVGCLIAGKEFMIYLRKKLWPANWRRKAHT